MVNNLELYSCVRLRVSKYTDEELSVMAKRFLGDLGSLETEFILHVLCQSCGYTKQAAINKIRRMVIPEV